MADDIVSQYYLANALRQGQRPSTRSILAQRMMGNALDTSPTTPLGALARALTGVVSAYTLRQAEEGDRLDQKQALASLMDRDQQQQDEVPAWQARLNGQGGQPPAGGAAPAPAPVMREALPGIGGPAPQGAPQPAQPGGDLVPRIIQAEAGNQGPQGMAAVASVIQNRARLTGMTPEQVVQQAGQFEPWGRRRQEVLGMPPERFASASDIWRQVSGGQMPDPTGGATHFLNPDLQRQLGRPMPAWAPEGQGQRIGAHVFYARPEDFRRAGGAPAGAVEGSAPGDVQATLEALRQGQGVPGAAAAGGGALPPSAAAAAAPTPPMTPMPSATAAPAPAAPAVNMQVLAEGLASNNPRIQRAAQAQLQALQLQRQTEAERRAEAAAGRQEERDRQAIAEQARQQARQEERDRLAQEAADRAEVRANQGPIPQGMRMNPQTQQLEPIPGFTPPSSQPTEQERISAGYASRMMAAEQTLSRVVQGGFNPGNWTDATMGRLPIVGNALTSEGGQLYRQAQEDWVRAKLRRESGAVIGAEEMAQEVRTYFPQPGDTPAMIAQKEQARRLASQAMVGAAGRGTIINPPEAPASPAAGPVTHRFNPQTGQVEAVN